MSRQIVLTVNAGSSSVKFSVLDAREEPVELARGQVSNIGADSRLSMHAGSGPKSSRAVDAANHTASLAVILDACETLIKGDPVTGIGHRIVHGGTEFDRPVVLDDTAIAKLRSLEALAPLHQPHNLAGVAAARKTFPQAIQVGCFDTAFHRGHPWVSDTYALPRSFYDRGVRRYGFHGLSFEYVSGELGRIAPELASGNVVVAHLGNGVSMCGIKAGRSMTVSTGFSALDGLPMGTRCGQIDPGILLYMMDSLDMDAASISDLLYRESGLKGLSGLSNDMRDLEASEDPKAAEAIEYFVCRIRRETGAMAAELGGLDGIVFCGGIGENSPLVRSRVCEPMGWLGIGIDSSANDRNAIDIGNGRVRVLVIPTDEERVIGRATVRALLDTGRVAQ